MAAQVIAYRRRFPHMGPRKIAVRLAELLPKIEWPAPSTIGDILPRANRIAPRPRRNRRPLHPLRSHAEPTVPNDLMTADYKGEFFLGNHRYCVTYVPGLCCYPCSRPLRRVGPRRPVSKVERWDKEIGAPASRIEL